MVKPILSKAFVFLIFLLTAPQQVQESKGPIYYGTPASISLEVTHQQRKLSPVQEEYMPADTLVQYLGEGNIPFTYSKNIRTSVCFDNQCRLLVATIYWNPTGRYLGFGLPEGEFLSKKEHDPFTVQEYERLNSLLADPTLPLGTISYNELVLESQLPIGNLGNIDGVSGATNKDLLSYIVEGAAYTTYKLYQLIYGPDQDFIEEWTLENLNEGFILQVLDSPVLSDQIWMLKRIKGRLAEFPKSKLKIAELTQSSNFSISDNALQAFTAKDIKDEKVEKTLLQVFDGADYGKRNRMLTLLESGESISSNSIQQLTHKIEGMESPFQVRIIQLFAKHRVNDSKFNQVVKRLSESGNAFVAKQAEVFLMNEWIGK